MVGSTVANGELFIADGLDITVIVQPLQLIVRPICLRRLKGFAGALPAKTHESDLMESVNQLSTPSARTLAKGELLRKANTPGRFHLKVSCRQLLGTPLPLAWLLSAYLARGLQVLEDFPCSMPW